jgi:hypothetical protein
LKCKPGYEYKTSTPYTCKAISGTTNAEYQGGAITCEYFVCTCAHGSGARN